MKNIENYKRRFYVLMESTIGDIKPLISEQQENPIEKKMALGTLNKLTNNSKDWESIVSTFSKELKKSLSRPKISKESTGYGILFGMQQIAGTLQNGGTSIKYEKTTDAYNNNEGRHSGGDSSRLSRVNSYILTVDVSYLQNKNKDIFNVDVLLKTTGTVQYEEEEGSGYRDYGSPSITFTISINKDSSGDVSYGMNVGEFKTPDSTIESSVNGFDIGNGLTTDDIVENMGKAFKKGLENNLAIPQTKIY